jgi:hypothetical protein
LPHVVPAPRVVSLLALGLLAPVAASAAPAPLPVCAAPPPAPSTLSPEAALAALNAPSIAALSPWRVNVPDGAPFLVGASRVLPARGVSGAVVLADDGETVRIVVEDASVRAILGVRHADLARAPTQPVALATMPGGPPGPVHLAAGADVRIVGGAAGSVHVAWRGDGVDADGWIAPTALGDVWSSCDLPAHAGDAVVPDPGRAEARLVAVVSTAPNGAPLAFLTGGVAPAVTAGPVRKGWRTVSLATPTVTIEGYAPADRLRPVPKVTLERRVARLATESSGRTIVLAAGTLATAAGAPIARVRQDVLAGVTGATGSGTGATGSGDTGSGATQVALPTPIGAVDVTVACAHTDTAVGHLARCAP